MKLSGRAWRVIFRLQNAWWDARAVLAGYCNHCPNSGVPGQGGGYTWWRCALRRGHEGMHRACNYVWSDDGDTSYLPTRPRQAMPDQPWRRSAGAMTRRQRRNREAWHRQQDAERKARLG